MRLRLVMIRHIYVSVSINMIREAVENEDFAADVKSYEGKRSSSVARSVERDIQLDKSGVV